MIEPVGQTPEERERLQKLGLKVIIAVVIGLILISCAVTALVVLAVS